MAECSRCGRVLAGPATGRVDTPLALAVAALLLLVPACVAPLIVVSTLGATRSSWLPSSATALWSDGYASLGLLVGVFSLALPFAFIALLLWVLGNLHFGRRDGLGPSFRWVKHLRPWVMTEVYLFGCLVAFSRINAVAAIDVGVGGWCLIAASLLILLAMTQLDERTVWEMLSARASTPRDGRAIACNECALLVAHAESGERCPRCAAKLHTRKPNSMQRTTALVAAGYLLYVPANALPVLTTVRFGREEHNTILSGVVELVHNDLWPLAVIVFAASIVLPLLKLTGLTWMLVAVRSRSDRWLVGRTRLYRMIEAVGRWSNIDVFAVSVLVAILQFGTLTAVHAGQGLVAFAAVVIATMIATMVFDTRLMWDVQRTGHG